MKNADEQAESFDAARRHADTPTRRDALFSSSFFSFPAILIILHVAVALFLAYVLNIWKDEASTLYTTQRGFFHALNNAATDEKQAPLYFIVLSVWRMLDGSIFFARLFSVICGAASIKFFYDLARRFLDEPAAKFVAAIFAVHPFLIWASVEIRVYAALILLSILLLKFFEAGFLNFQNEDVETQKRNQIYYVLTAVISLYTNYYLGFVLVGGFFALLVLRRFQTARRYFLQMLAVGVVFLPLLWIVKQQFADNTNGFIEPTSLAEGLKFLSNQIQNFAFPMELSPDAAPSAVSLIRIWFLRAAAAMIVFFLFKNKFRALNEKVLASATITVTICAFLLAAYFLLGAEYLATRHFTVLFAPFVLFLGALSASVLPRKYWILCAVLFALLFPYTKIYKQFPAFTKRSDWARVARFIEQNEKPNQPIIVFPTYDALALPYYYKGANRVLPDEKFFAWNFEDAPSSENAYRKQIEFVISEIPPDAPEIRLATDDICQNPETAPSCRPLENFIAAHYTVEDTRDFYFARVRLLRKK